MHGKKLLTALIAIPAAVAALAVIPGVVSAAPGGPVNQGAAAQPASVTAPVRPVLPGPGPQCVHFAAESPQTRVVTDDFNHKFSSSKVWTTVPCGKIINGKVVPVSVSISVPPGRKALVVAHVDAEVSCKGPKNQWCQGRVLIDGVEGEPNAPEPDSFAWATARGNLFSWEANAFTRTKTVTCHRRTTCAVPVVLQVRNHAPGMTMRVDDLTLHVQANFGNVKP